MQAKEKVCPKFSVQKNLMQRTCEALDFQFSGEQPKLDLGAYGGWKMKN